MGGTISSQITNALIMYAICFFEILISSQFYRSYLEEKRTATQRQIVAILLAAALTVYNAMFSAEVLVVLGMAVALFALAKLSFECNFIQSLFGVAIIAVAGVLSEGLSVLFVLGFLRENFNRAELKDGYLLFMGVLSKTIFYLTIRIIIHFRLKVKYQYANRSLNAMLLFPIILALTMCIMVLQMMNNSQNDDLFMVSIVGVMGLASCIFIVRVYENSLDRSELRYQLRMAQAEASYSDSIAQNEQVLKQRQHEFKNMLFNIKGLLSRSEYKEADDYIDKAIMELGDKKGLAPTADFSNKVFNVIINNNRLLCGEMDIDLKATIEYPDLSFINPIDTGTLLNNAFNNAIDGCRTVPGGEVRYIKLRIHKLHDELIIAMANSKRNAIVENKGELVSTKNITKNHGNGFRNMVDCAKRYGGVVDFADRGNEFTLQIRLKCE